MNGICIDLGASSTRVTGMNGVIHFIPNDLIFKDRTELVDLETHLTGTDKMTDFLTSMDILIEKVAGKPCDAFPARALIGDLANRSSATTLRPSVMMNKSKQKINKFNLLVAAIQQAYVYGVNNQPITLYVALPPLEVLPEIKNELANELIGTYHVVCDKLGWETTICIGNVKCFQESYMALAAFFFDFPSCKLNAEKASKYGKGYVMSLDIGASTTDVSVAKDMGLLEKSGQTIKTGCNVIELSIGNSIRSKFGYDPTHEELLQVIMEGRLLSGSSHVNVGDILRKAKTEFAQTIVAELQSYFRLVNIPLQSIRCIIASGGGSLTSGYVDEETGEFIPTCPCISEFITKEFNNIVESIDVVSMDDPRTANVRGLYIRMRVDAAQEAKAAAEAAAQQGTAPVQQAVAPVLPVHTQQTVDASHIQPVNAAIPPAMPQVSVQTVPTTPNQM